MLKVEDAPFDDANRRIEIFLESNDVSRCAREGARAGNTCRPAWPLAPLTAATGGSIGQRPAAYQMEAVSLQLVQDRIADGDHAAMPMQTRLIEMIGRKRLRHADSEVFEGRNANLRCAPHLRHEPAGNPATFESVLARLDLDEETQASCRRREALFDGQSRSRPRGLHGCGTGQVVAKRGGIRRPGKGNRSSSAANPKLAIGYFDQARLLAPGTLVEEAALRRAIRGSCDC